MNDMNDKQKKTVEKLIEVLKDGQEGFKITAEKIDDSSIKAQFLDFSEQRAKFVVQLAPYLSSADMSTSVGGAAVKAAGVIHRGWIDVKSALGGGDSAILNEAERGEDYAVKAYQDAMEEPLPQELSSLIKEQFLLVKSTHDKVKSYRDSK